MTVNTYKIESPSGKEIIVKTELDLQDMMIDPTECSRLFSEHLETVYGSIEIEDKTYTAAEILRQDMSRYTQQLYKYMAKHFYSLYTPRQTGCFTLRGYITDKALHELF